MGLPLINASPEALQRDFTNQQVTTSIIYIQSIGSRGLLIVSLRISKTPSFTLIFANQLILLRSTPFRLSNVGNNFKDVTNQKL